LTIKFTRGTAAPPLAFSFQPSALSKTTTRRGNSMGLDPAHRAKNQFRVSSFAFPVRTRNLKHETLKLPHAPAGFLSGTHKNLQPCRLPNLFSCQISSSLGTSLVVRPWPLAKNKLHDLPAARLSGYGYSPSSC